MAIAHSLTTKCLFCALLEQIFLKFVSDVKEFFKIYVVKWLKVNKNRNDFMKTGRLDQKATYYFYSRAEILTIIALLFGPNGVFIKSFRFLPGFLLTFSKFFIMSTEFDKNISYRRHDCTYRVFRVKVSESKTIFG